MSQPIRSGFRKIVLESGTWTYRVGRQYVVIFSPTGQRFCPNHSEITGLSWNAIERAKWKGAAAAITPSVIQTWIEKL